jgi:DNA replication protein DnaC
MEKQTQTSASPKTDSLTIIGIRKYEFLKTFNPEELTADQKEQMRVFENKQKTPTPEQIEKYHDYLEKIAKPKEIIQFTTSAKVLWQLFKANFPIVNQRPFIKIGGIDGVSTKNLEPLVYYFSKDERFFECENLSKLSEPSFDKGLLIIGTFGNGKTSTMKVFEHIFKSIPGVGFKGYSANEVVLQFEKCSGNSADALRTEFIKRMYNGNRYFDDLKTERIASNFGKVNIFKEILEERYNRKSKTFITANFKEGFENDIEAAVDEFGEKYGPRVYDRLFEMFNIIEFKGKSFRK